MKSLYLVLLGGKHEQANVEVHDVIPVICSDLTEVYPYLKQQWFGKSQGLHIDGWMKIQGTIYHDQSYQLVISQEESPSELKPYLINLGAYLPNEFGETHKYLVVAGKDKADAKAQGKLAIEKHWFKPHTDAVIDLDDCLEIASIEQHYLSFVQGEFLENSFMNDYIILP
ncbi:MULTISPECIES: DUF1543 domain-containing protein [Acinetobacter]|uniref:DUF1543 domain-containing protein n=1 Tax=Acinetobacter corruptisaponis TaxID=3045147 RepID=A0ABY8S6W2_9GAMM|nr:DUF1543 domain-containing protein [Acinetobacter sp. KCTC 92772]WHP07211.1 DUF1543 domain-containing protein [Acinetobacter sp. KCTC 92772]